jgi:putative cell wall-binding protein
MPLPRRPLPALVAGLLLCALLPAPAAFAAAGERWSLSGTDPVTAAVDISRMAFPSGAPSAVLARSDQFPDALAAGVLLRDGPLLLTATAALSEATAAELARLGVKRVTILGGESAVSAAVATALRTAGYQVSRLAGAGRVETAVAVASSRPASRTVILARASSGADATQGFADALAAGAWAAASGFPVLLSDTAALSAPTAAYLRAARVGTVMIVGGTGAVSAQVERQLLGLGVAVRRLSGRERSATATAIAAAQGYASAADVGRVVLVDGRGANAWAAGFGAAALAAGGKTAVLLAETAALPAPTTTFLAKGRPELVCAPLLAAGRCDDAATALRLADPVVSAFDAASLLDAERAAGAGRAYTVGVRGGGPVTVALVDAALAGSDDGGWVLDDDGDGLADGLGAPDATIASVTGARITAGGVVGGLRSSGGRLAFTVSAAEAGPGVRPVAFLDLDGDGGLDVAGDGSVLEPAAVGGATVWVPGAAGSGSYADQVVVQAWPGLNLVTTATATYRWNSGDAFAYNSGLAAVRTLTRAEFASMISAGDTIAANVGTSSTRLSIVRDLPAAPGGLRVQHVDSDGDGVEDLARATWTRPPNIDLAVDSPYSVEQSTRGDDGTWGSWSDAAEGETPSDLTDDLDIDAGEHRFRIRALNEVGDSGAASRPVLLEVGEDVADAPPAAMEAEFTAGAAQPDTNTVLDVGDRFAITFDGPIEVGSGASIDLRDEDGTLVRLTRGGNAAFAVGGENGEILTVSVTGALSERSGSEGDDDIGTEDLVVVEAADGIGNGAGEWNLPESGWEDAEEDRTRTVVGSLGDLPAAIDPDDVEADAGLGEVTIAAGAAGIADDDDFAVYDWRGKRIATGTYDAADGTTVETDDFAEGERLYVIYTAEDTASLPSASTALLVPSSRPELSAVEGSGDSIVLVWAEDVELQGDEGDVAVYDADDRVLVSEAEDVEAGGDDRIVVELEDDLVTGEEYVVRVEADLVEDEAEDGNAAQVLAFTAAAATPTLTVATGPADNATSATSTVTWTGTAADTVGVVTAVERRLNGGSWVATGITDDAPGDSVTWTAALTLDEGDHTVELRAVDNNGVASTVASRTITVDAAAPTMTAAAATIGAKTITVTFSEAVTCPDDDGASAWTFDDTVGAVDGTGNVVSQPAADQCTITFTTTGDANFAASTAGTLTYGAPAGDSRVLDLASTPMASNSAISVTAA